jgi:ADP-ribose pyrophosphatase
VAAEPGTRHLEPWTIEQRQRVFDGYVKIEQRTYRMPDGRTSDWDVIEGSRTVAAVARELREETGYVAGSMTHLANTWLSARAEVERHIVLADDCTMDGVPTPDRDEITEVVLLDPAAFAAHVRSGDMTDMDAGLLALDHLGLS